jgi:hypothetical protein
MECFRFPVWQNPYIDAVQELDTQKFRQRVIAAEEAVLSRAHQIENLITDNDEKLALNNALKSLRVLRGVSEWV